MERHLLISRERQCLHQKGQGQFKTCYAPHRPLGALAIRQQDPREYCHDDLSSLK